MEKEFNSGFDSIQPRWQEYERFLEHRLCWHDGTPTHDSDGVQRQCPACRHKWSYEARRTEFYLLRMFCRGETATAAARAAHCARNTANKHHSRFRAAAVEIAIDMLRTREETGIAIRPTTGREAKALEHALRPGASERRKFRACWVIIGMNADLEEQMQLLFTREIAPDIPRLVPDYEFVELPSLQMLRESPLEPSFKSRRAPRAFPFPDAPPPPSRVDRFVEDLRKALRSEASESPPSSAL